MSVRLHALFAPWSAGVAGRWAPLCGGARGQTAGRGEEEGEEESLPALACGHYIAGNLQIPVGRSRPSIAVLAVAFEVQTLCLGMKWALGAAAAPHPPPPPPPPPAPHAPTITDGRYQPLPPTLPLALDLVLATGTCSHS